MSTKIKLSNGDIVDVYESLELVLKKIESSDSGFILLRKNINIPTQTVNVYHVEKPDVKESKSKGISYCVNIESIISFDTYN